jgi:DNA helicase-2/ATP-dependent DNA helicase PcrA
VNAAAGDIGNERDAHVVEDICSFVTDVPPRSFFLFAGAGSGKTRTLVEVLRRITGVIEHAAGGIYAAKLRERGQSVRVITYTKNAAKVVTSRLGENRLTEVSTIHSFCWDLVKGFDDDIRQAPHYQERCHPSQSQTWGLDGAQQCVVTARRSRLMSEGG